MFSLELTEMILCLLCIVCVCESVHVVYVWVLVCNVMCVEVR